MIIKENFDNYIKIFLEENSKVNLISKNDEKYLWEKHIFDSLSISKFFEKYNYIPSTILDIGTGGGFPAVPIAIKYPNIKVTAVDSIGKKIKAVTTISENLHLNNLFPICSRVENISGEYDVVVSRAVSSLKNICEYALPKTTKNGYFIAYKSKKAPEEIEDAAETLKKHRLTVQSRKHHLTD